MTTPNPRKIEWPGPCGWTVWADEDGVHIKASSDGALLESAEAERLFALWNAVRSAMRDGQIPAPKPPTREEMSALSGEWRERAEERRALRAIKREFATDNTVPF